MGAVPTHAIFFKIFLSFSFSSKMSSKYLPWNVRLLSSEQPMDRTVWEQLNTNSVRCLCSEDTLQNGAKVTLRRIVE